MSAYVFVAVGGGSIGLLAGGVLTQFTELALDLLRECAYRHRHADPRPLPHCGERRPGHQTGRRLGRVDAWSRVSVMVAIYGVVTATTYGWVSAAHAGFARPRGRALRRLHRPRVAPGQSDHAAAHSEAAHADRLGRHPWPAHHRHVLDLLHRGPLLRARAGLQPGQDRVSPSSRRRLVMAIMSTGITAKLVNRFGAQAGDVPGHGHGGGRAWSCSPPPDQHAAATSRGSSSPSCWSGLGAGRVLHAVAADRHVGDPQRRRRLGLGRRQRLPADGGRHRTGRAEHDRRRTGPSHSSPAATG